MAKKTQGRWFFILPLIYIGHIKAQSYDVISNFLEQSFAYTIVMSDSDVFTVGFADFNPNNLFNTHNENLGTYDSVENRKKYGITTIPMSFRLNDEQDTNTHSLLVRFSGLTTEDSIRWPGESQNDDLTQTILDMYIAYRYEHVFDENWSIEPGLGTHLMHYQNSMTYNSRTGRQFQPVLDSLLFNTTAWANVYEPHVRVNYQQNEPWGKWKLSSSGHYFYGYGWGEANGGDPGNPEGWYLVNSATAVYDFNRIGSSTQSIYSTIRRVDVGSDVEHNLGTSSYYEASLGWLMTPPFNIDFIDNIGLGLTFNYGSAFKGGSLVLFFNQD